MSQQKSRIERFGMVFAAVLFGLAGIVASIVIVYNFIQGTKSKNWATTTGSILSCKITKYPGEDFGYNAQLNYKYTVNGKEYKGDKIFIHKVNINKEKAQELEKLYPKDAKVQVFYNSNAPSQSVLQPGYHNPKLLLVPAFVLLLIILGIWDYFEKKQETATEIVVENTAEIEESNVLYEIPNKLRYGDAGLELFMATLILWVAVLVTLQEVIMPKAIPQTRAGIAIVVAFPISCLFCWIRFRIRLYKIDVRENKIVLYTAKKEEKIATDSVKAIIGLGSVSFDGGEMLVWRKLLLVTEKKLHMLKTGEASVDIYEQFVATCSKAVQLPYKGKLQLPITNTSEENKKTLNILQRLFFKESFKSIACVLLFMGGPLLLISLIQKSGENLGSEGSANLAMLIIPCFFVGFLFLGEWFRNIKAYIKMRK